MIAFLSFWQRALSLPVAALAAILCAHGALLVGIARGNSPTWDETAHLAAGVGQWHFGRFSWYRVNPPLVRTVAAAPVMLAGPNVDWQVYGAGEWGRSEFVLGAYMAKANGARFLDLVTMARLACVPFGAVGAIVCFLWARDLYGPWPGVSAAALWSFCPNALGHGSLITPDVAAAALGAWAGYAFFKWLEQPGIGRAILCGFALGAAELTKMTWVLLFGLWPLLWLVWRVSGRSAPTHAVQPPFAQLAAILFVGLWLLNAGYAFQGTFRRLDSFTFASKLMVGPTGSVLGDHEYGNRFSGSWLGALPVPLPADYVLGADAQKRDFEGRFWTYLRGQWKQGSWPVS